MVAMTRYSVTAERSGRWWVLQADQAPGAITQIARLDQADQIIEAIAFVTGEPEASIEIEVRPVLPESIRTHLAEAARLRAEAAAANTRAAQETRAAARRMHDELALTVRDIGRVMDVSDQRASQLING